jgi:DNA repair exonuclease SbcCD ATPase subunit
MPVGKYKTKEELTAAVEKAVSKTDDGLFYLAPVAELQAEAEKKETLRKENLTAKIAAEKAKKELDAKVAELTDEIEVLKAGKTNEADVIELKKQLAASKRQLDEINPKIQEYEKQIGDYKTKETRLAVVGKLREHAQQLGVENSMRHP